MTRFICTEHRCLRNEKRSDQKFPRSPMLWMFFNASLSTLRETVKSHPKTTMPTTDRDLIYLNIDLQERRVEDIVGIRTKLSDSLKAIEKQTDDIDKELAELKPRLLELHRKRNHSVDEMLDSKVQARAQIGTIFNSVSATLDLELEQIRNFLLQEQEIWPIEYWLTEDSSKENAIMSIRKTLGKHGGSADGIFLIRVSQSRPGFFALEVTKGATIHSCLIEKGQPNAISHPNSEEWGETGYAFSNTNMFFCTLQDFVRYYSQVPLMEHNFKLDTKLNIPAFLPS